MGEKMQKSDIAWFRRGTLGGLAVAAMILAGGGVSTAQAQDSDTIVIARDMDIDSLDPSRAFCDTCQIYVSSVYDRLVDLGPDNRSIVPLLAESWEINEDQTEFVFRLDPDARFADGSAVEARDVKWSFERLKNMKGNPAFLMDGVTAIETPDAHTVVIELEAPNSEFLGILTAPYAGIINADLAMEHGASAEEDADSADQAEGWFLENSAGSGPFILATYRPNDELRLVRNENYWRDGPGVDAIVFRQTQTAVAQAQMLEAGGADIAMQVDPDTAANIASQDVTVETVPSFNFVYVAVGAGAEGMDVELNRNLREAIAMALDYEGIIDMTVAGEGNLQAAPIPNGFPGTDDLPMPARDLDRARELLEEEGLGDGFTIEAVFPGINVYGVDLTQMMQKVQQDLSDVGIEITLQPVTFSVWRERITSEGIPLTAVFYAPDYFGSGQYVQFFGMMEGTAWYNRAHADRAPDAANPRQADLLASALAASEEESAGYFHELAQEMIHDRIIIPLVSPNLVLAYRNDIEGVRYSACCNLPTAELQRR
jgi:peptide/nickel transport system substrate-binding protein